MFRSKLPTYFSRIGDWRSRLALEPKFVAPENKSFQEMVILQS